MSFRCSYAEYWCCIGTFPTKQKLVTTERMLRAKVLPTNFQGRTYMTTTTVLCPYFIVSFQTLLNSGTCMIMSHRISNVIRENIRFHTRTHIPDLHTYSIPHHKSHPFQEKKQDFGCDLALYVILHMMSSILDHRKCHTFETLDLRSFNGTNTRCNARRWLCALR